MIWTDDPKSDEVIAHAEQRGLKLIMTVGAEGETIELVSSKCRRRSASNWCLGMAGRDLRLDLPLIGAYQVNNVLTAAGLVLATGGDWATTLAGDGAGFAGARAAGTRGDQPRAARRSMSIMPIRPTRWRRRCAALRPHVEGRLITVVRRRRRPRQGQARADGRSGGADQATSSIVTDDNPRSEDPAAHPRASPGGRTRRDRDRRPPRGDRRGAAAGGQRRHRPARRQGPRDRADRSATRCCRSTMRRWRGSARRDRLVDLRTKSRPRPAARRALPFEVSGVTFDSREVGAGRSVRRDARRPRATGMISSRRRSRRARLRRWCRKPVDGPHVLVPDVAEALTALAVAARRADRIGDGDRGHRVGRQDRRPRKRLPRRWNAAARGRSTARSRATTTIPASR